MKKVSRYKCEICGKEFTSELSADRCERDHHMPVKASRYGKFSDVRNYPAEVVVEFDNYGAVLYEFKGIMNRAKGEDEDV